MTEQNNHFVLTLFKHEHLIYDASTGRVAQLTHISPEPCESDSLLDLRIYSEYEYAEILDHLGNQRFDVFGSKIEHLNTTDFKISGVLGPLAALADKVLEGTYFPWSLEIHD